LAEAIDQTARVVDRRRVIAVKEDRQSLGDQIRHETLEAYGVGGQSGSDGRCRGVLRSWRR
jgi:hypothetical protein